MDMKAAIEALGITKDEVLERAATILANETAEEHYVGDSVDRIIRERVDAALGKDVSKKIDDVLTKEFDALLSREYVPVDMWGEPTGKATTIRDQLVAHARTFWDEKVDENGKKTTSYGGRPRHEWLLGRIIGDEFTKALSLHYIDVAAAIKDAVRDDAHASIDKHIDTIFRVKKRP